MHVLFLEIDTQRDWALASVGPAFLASYLRAHGHDAGMIRVAPEATVDDVVEQIRSARPGLIGISLTTRQWLRARDLVGALRSRIDVPIVAGGLHPTFAPEQVLAAEGFDYVCLGEGEQAILELVNYLDQHSNGSTDQPPIANIWHRNGPRPELRPPFHPADNLPFLARDMMDERYGVIHMSTQRGCPFPCTYCAAGMYNRMYGANSNYGRRRSLDNVLAEVETIRAAGPLHYIIFLDDTFTIQPSWVMAFCEAYGPRFRIPFSLHARADTVSREMIEALADCGCRHIIYGVESGSLRIRQQIMQRPITNQQMIDVFRSTREAGILVTANYMLGMPTETREDLQQTLDLHVDLQPDDFGYFVFYPYPGTRLFEVCREQGLLPDDYLERPAVHHQSILTLPDLTADDINEYYDRFTKLREATQLGRLVEPTPEQQEQIHADVHRCAATN